MKIENPTEFIKSFHLDTFSATDANGNANIPVKDPGILIPGHLYIFDCLEEVDGKDRIIAGSRKFNGSAVNYFLVTDKASADAEGVPTAILASQLWRVAYLTNAEGSKLQPVCDASRDIRNQVINLDFERILASPALVNKTIECTGVQKAFVRTDRDKPISPDNATEREYPTFNVLK